MGDSARLSLILGIIILMVVLLFLAAGIMRNFSQGNYTAAAAAKTASVRVAADVEAAASRSDEEEEEEDGGRMSISGTAGSAEAASNDYNSSMSNNMNVVEGRDLEGSTTTTEGEGGDGDVATVMRLLEMLIKRLGADDSDVAEDVLRKNEEELEEVGRAICALVNARILGGSCSSYVSAPTLDGNNASEALSAAANSSPDPVCCVSLRPLLLQLLQLPNSAANSAPNPSTSPISRRILCSCFRDVAKSVGGLKVLSLPLRCGVAALAALPLLAHPSVQCSTLMP